MQRADPIIHSKLRLPFTQADLVSRPRLQERIWQGLRGPLSRLWNLNLDVLSVVEIVLPAVRNGGK